ncbi:MAG: ClpP family protease [Candidatus Paceibacterota bacterium]
MNNSTGQHNESGEPTLANPPISDLVAHKLLKTRTLLLGTQVDDKVANLLVGQMLILASEDPEKEITLFINSPGGSVSAGMAIYDTMQYLPTPVRTVAYGLAASMGQFLLTAGTPGRRFALPNTRIMMHQPLGGFGGTASDIRIQAEQMKYTKRLMAELIAKHSNQTLEQINKDSDRDRWFSAAEAAEYGLIDGVLSPEALLSNELKDNSKTDVVGKTKKGTK